MIKINHRIVFWIFSILIIGMILLSCGCNQLLKFYFPQSFSVSKNEMTTNDYNGLINEASGIMVEA